MQREKESYQSTYHHETTTGTNPAAGYGTGATGVNTGGIGQHHHDRAGFGHHNEGGMHAPGTSTTQGTYGTTTAHGPYGQDAAPQAKIAAATAGQQMKDTASRIGYNVLGQVERFAGDVQNAAARLGAQAHNKAGRVGTNVGGQMQNMTGNPGTYNTHGTTYNAQGAPYNTHTTEHHTQATTYNNPGTAYNTNNPGTANNTNNPGTTYNTQGGTYNSTGAGYNTQQGNTRY